MATVFQSNWGIRAEMAVRDVENVELGCFFKWWLIAIFLRGQGYVEHNQTFDLKQKGQTSVTHRDIVTPRAVLLGSFP